MMSFGCCPLFAVAVGSVSCFMLCVSVSAFLWFWHLDGLWSLHTGLSLRAPTGVVCVFFPHACHVFLPVGLPAGLLCFLLCLLVVFLLWLFCWLCRVFVGVFCWLLSCLLGVVCLLFVCWSVLVFGCFAGFLAFRPFLLVVWSSGVRGCGNVNSGFSRVFGVVGCCFENRSCIHGRIHMILGDYGGFLAVFL